MLFLILKLVDIEFGLLCFAEKLLCLFSFSSWSALFCVVLKHSSVVSHFKLIYIVLLILVGKAINLGGV